MRNRFETKRGRLTVYALACGYVERKEAGDVRLDLWHEGACFHVRAHDFAGRGRLFWESFPTLKEARRFFDSSKRHVFKSAACAA